MTRTKPEWPEPGQPDTVWKFDEPVTFYEFSIHGETVTDHQSKYAHLRFGPYAQHTRNVSIGMAGFSIQRDWPDWAWMVLVRGLHPLSRKERIECHGGVTVHSGQERMEIEDFERWLISEQLETLVDFREAAIAEGWRPPYGGCSSAWHEWPSLPPLHLAHWYPERTVLSCSPSREEWTESRLNYYLDHDYGHFEYRASAFLGDSEFSCDMNLGILIESLRFKRNRLAREQKETKKKFPHLFQKKGETKTQWNHRWLELSRAEQDQQNELDTSEEQRQIFRAIKALREDRIPELAFDGGQLPEVKALQERCDQAEEAERQRLRAKAAIDFPVNDEVWEMEVESRKAKELERQAKLREFQKARKKAAGA